jgi:Domain of unknown function (DUF4386)
MSDERRPLLGAAAGAVAVALFVANAIVIGDRPAFDSPAAEVAAFFDEERTRIQLSCALIALAAPLLVWFLATVASLTRDAGPGARAAAAVAYGCGLVYLALFMADVAALAAGALRPGNLASEPELAAALVDFEFMAIGMASPLGAATLAALAALVLRHDAVWPRWVGVLAAIAAPLYALRLGTLFTTDGAFAADGMLGIYVPVAALAGWLFIASVVLVLELRRPQAA